VLPGFYRRELPEEICIDFASPKGKLLFAESLRDNQVESFFKMAGIPSILYISFVLLLFESDRVAASRAIHSSDGASLLRHHGARHGAQLAERRSCAHLEEAMAMVLRGHDGLLQVLSLFHIHLTCS